jgi:hypothetical protein
MRIRTMAGIVVAGAAAAVAVVGGVAYASGDETEPTVRIVTEREAPVENAAGQPAQDSAEKDCPEDGATTEGAGL